jgi:hypothetical protein
MPKRIPHASSHLRKSEQIAAVLGTIERNRRLLRAVHALLAAPLDAHCLHASLDGGRLTLDTDSPVWSSRLRFFAPELQGALAGDYGPIDACRVRVRPALAPKPTEERANAIRRLAPETVANLLQVAENLGEGDLSDALRRLARTGAGGH